MAGTPQFVDISAFQGSIDFNAYSAWARQWDGVARVAIKATEGVGFTDPAFEANRAGALNAEIDSIIYYHFARPDLGNTPLAEANWMMNVVGDIRAGDMIILDYEVEAPQSTAQWALAWLTEFSPRYGKLPGIYASLGYIEARLQWPGLNAFPLWLADWQFTPDERPACPPPWSQYEFLQYTDNATNIPGIATNVDADIFLGGPLVNNLTYGPGSPDFDQWFTQTDPYHWTCKQNESTIQYGNLALYGTLSISGYLPVIGLPLENEQYHTESDNYQWSSQRFERATMVYDPAHRFDNQPGMGTSYLAHQPDAQPAPQPTIPDALKADLQALPAALTGMVTKLLQDAGLPTS